ncbi:GTP pyrophosphokinase family protein [Phaeobacter sp. HF9A]|uniref:GTP pyrophosphokinase n=1 Tax=Phaeobacter sp. HF9A TaxID=2721561 RepID=UPI0014308953|nr:RelA/SpoT domain-containing protein [Phaeobacter sp. HF9A]NIZ15709.1 RelA/SpoT domain-containing protein [Phaeobacter sp. HF9A]
MNLKKFEEDLSNSKKIFEKLNEAGKTIIKHHLEERNIPFSEIKSRIKDPNSAIEKQRSKKYESPMRDMTDLVAFRVIVFLESDVEKVEEILRSTFEIDENNCIDKRKKSIDQVGYRSLHLVCSLGDDRKSVPEYSTLCNSKFEIQIRTALENAWAEIEHKQNYKGENSLPESLQRRLMIVAGALELVDKEFSNIVKEAAQYTHELANSTESVLEDKISTTSAEALLENLAKEEGKQYKPVKNKFKNTLIGELAAFGINSNKELKGLIETTKAKVLQNDDELTLLGFYRDSMMAKDLERYLRASYNNSFTFLLDEIEFLEGVCEYKNVRSILKKYDADFDEVRWSDIE